MSAVGYRLRATLRARWGTVTMLTAIVVVLFGVVITFAAGAQRTITVADRYTESVGGDFSAVVKQEEEGRPRTDEIRALPGVADAVSYTFVFGGVQSPDAGEEVSPLVFAGSELAIGRKIVRGRAADPAVEGEFVATPNFVAAAHAELGDQFELLTFTQEQGDSGQFGLAEPAGPHLAATLVGVADGPSTTGDQMAVFSSAVLERPGIGVSQSEIFVRLEDGVDIDEFRARLDTLPDSATFSVGPSELITTEMRRAINTQGRGLWILAIVTGIAAVAVLGQVITRQVRLPASERRDLSAIGLTERQMSAESGLLAGIPIVLGSLLGAIVSVPFSGVFPTGFTRQVEPYPGVLVLWGPMIVVFAVLTIALLVWTAASLMMTRSGVRSVRSSPTLDAFASRATSPAAGLGLRFAFTRAKGERGSVQAALAGVLLTLCGLVAAITFGASVQRLIDEPFRYGVNYDVAMGDNGGEQISADLADMLVADPDVVSLTFYAGGFGRDGSTTVPLSGIEVIRGEITPPVISGRLPVGDDEIGLGRTAAGDVGVDVGDSITLAGLTGTQTYRVTGIVVVTGLGSNEGIGEGGVVTLPGLARLDDTANVVSAVVQFRPGSHPVDRYLALFPDQTPEAPYRPEAIVNIDRVKTIPFALAAVLALLAVLTVAHGMLTSVRSRQRDLAVIRSLGADRGFVSRTVHWQATVFTLAPALIAVPLGFVVGRTIFATYADGIGAIDSAAVPMLVVGAVLVGVVALANLAAILPARRFRRTPPAIILQRE